MNYEAQFKTALRTAGERVTQPRLNVFRVLLRHAPLSMADLITQAGADSVDQVTTYRAVDLFRRLGIVQEVGLGRNRLFELGDQYQAHHHHFICLDCGAITDFDSQDIEHALAKAGQNLGFKIRSHQLEAGGLCRQCQDR